MTEEVAVDDVEADEEGIVDVVLDDNSIRAVPRPGTSLRCSYHLLVTWSPYHLVTWSP